jgi:hypothetical protein
MRGMLIKIGAKVVSHGRYATFQMARSKFRGRCSRGSWCSPSNWGCGPRRRDRKMKSDGHTHELGIRSILSEAFGL